MQLRVATFAVLIAVLAGCSAADEGSVDAEVVPTGSVAPDSPAVELSETSSAAGAAGAKATGESLTRARDGVDAVTFRAHSPSWDASGSSASRVRSATRHS